MKINWTLLAEKSYKNILVYLNEEWNSKISQDFILEVNRTMLIITDNPYCFPEYEFDVSYRKGFIYKNTSFYYKVIDNEIVVFLFWNNYQNPDKLKFQLLNS